ncbi:MAG: proline dehydrogenase family protein [Gemmatimonadetes bacterium]|nr:proline dehydrogenase family protein [Gemmatimonadota bacterium]
MNALDRTVAGLVPRLPRPVVGLVAKRYIAGETLDSALATARSLNAANMSVTMDVLGENIRHLDEAARTVQLYQEVVERIHSSGVVGNVSVKLTHFGLKLSRDRCAENLRTLATTAERAGMFIRIDMEDSSTTSDTLGIFEGVREVYPNVGVVIQAYLRRSENDVRELARTGARVRVCKGIYREPLDIAFHDPEEIRRSFLRLVEILLEGGSHVAIATHDEKLVEGAYRLLDRIGPSVQGRYEFQMLLGVREALRDEIVAKGHPLRVYVPFGEQWYAYSVRRLRENPAIAGHVFRALLGLK